MYVLSLSGELLFSGSRRDAKIFVRKNNIKQYKFSKHPGKGKGKPKLLDIPVDPDPSTDPIPLTNPLSEPDTPEGNFNTVFNDE
jgi:hypothetical protein